MTVTLGEFVDVTGEVVVDIWPDDDDETLTPFEAVGLLDSFVIGGVVDMLDGADVVVAVDPALADCVTPVVGADFVTVGAALPEVVGPVVLAGALIDDSTEPAVGAGVVVELHAASESVTAAASPAR